jgi:hypothetical protein
MVAPGAGRCGGGNCDSPLAFLFHPVHRRGAIVHLTHAMDSAGEVQNPLAERCFARIDMGHDPNIAELL